MAEKFTLPTETIELPSQGKVYPLENPLSSGKIEMKYMTAREEDILTNINLLRQGIAIEKMLQSLIKSPIQYDDLLLGDRNGLLIAARILAYGSSYSFQFNDSEQDVKEEITIDLQTLSNKLVDFSIYKNTNEFSLVLPASSNTVTFKLLTVGDEKIPSIETLIGIHDKMKDSVPFHASPYEHCSICPSQEEYDNSIRGSEKGWFRNYRGFIQYRDLIEN